MGSIEPGTAVATTLFREVRCKDCLRELEGSEPAEGRTTQFEYSEAWAEKTLDRGGSRTDRCPRHRREHRTAIQAIAVAYVDLVTIGEVRDRSSPSGPLGGLGELPEPHRPKPVSVDLSRRKFGMTDDNIREALRKLGDDKTRVLVLRAGTGTGKSTFCPYRLMNPPRDKEGDEDLIQLTKLGPIVVTEPRVQATTGVARFVGEKLIAGCKWKSCGTHGRFVPEEDADPGSPEGPPHDGPVLDDCVITECSDHIGPGYPVGYQVKDDKKHDESCQLIYVTDGTMVNWLRDGRLSKIGTVIVDEAHERSVNIDFIMGELSRQLPRYPHLRVVVASATFDVDFYVDFFGGPEFVASMDIPPVKSFGYGAPLFPYPNPGHGGSPPCSCIPPTPETDAGRHRNATLSTYESWLDEHWPVPRVEDGVDEATAVAMNEIRDLTRRLERLRYDGPILDDPFEWGRGMKESVVYQLTRMITGLDEMEVPGDILAFLPTEKLITAAVREIEARIAPDQADLYGLIGSMAKADQDEALAARPEGARRKVVIATNLAETSLTVEGVRFVVDSGIITQSAWNPVTASGTVPTEAHSRAGIRQRWGRVGRDAAGWVFPLYTTGAFWSLPKDTPPGSTRQNLEKLIMTAKAGGVDDIAGFPWPAQHPFGEPDAFAKASRQTFELEIKRAELALRLNGVLDDAGDLTHFGKEMVRFTVSGASASTAFAVMFADQLACVPEVAAAIGLLDVPRLYGPESLFLDDQEWPFDIQFEAEQRRRALRTACTDDLDLVLRIAAAWDRADAKRPPWELTDARRSWSQRLWLNERVLAKAAAMRREVLTALSPVMNEEVKRFVDTRLGSRARAVLSRAMTSLQYILVDGSYVSVSDPTLPPGSLDRAAIVDGLPERLLAMKRTLRQRNGVETVVLEHLVRVTPWACDEGLDVFELLERAAAEVSPRVLKGDGADTLVDYVTVWPAGIRFRATLDLDGDDATVSVVNEVLDPRVPPRSAADPAQVSSPERTDRENNWIFGVPLPDDDDLGRRPTDTADDPQDREKGLETNDDEETSALAGLADPQDALAAWHPTSAPVADRASVRVSLQNGPAGPGDAYACFGYEIGDDGAVALLLATELYVVEVAVSEADRGRVIGKGRVRINALQHLPGVLWCEFDGRSGPLRVVGTTESAVKAVLGEVDKAPTRVSGTMRMPGPSFAGLLIGSGGQRVATLKTQSGCLHASYVQGTADWELAGPTTAAIERFIELANEVVPGCVGSVEAQDRPSVTDVIEGRVLRDWRLDSLSAISVAEHPRSGVVAGSAQLDPDGVAPAAFAVVTDGSGRATVYAAGDDTLAGIGLSRDGMESTWSAIRDAPDGWPVSLAGASYGARSDLIVSFGEESLWHRWREAPGVWSDWREVQGPEDRLLGPIASVSPVDGHLEVYAIDDRGSVLHARASNARWGGWHQLPPPPGGEAVAVAACSAGEGHSEVFVACRDGSLWRRWTLAGEESEPQWSGMTDPGVVSAAVGASSRSDGDFEWFTVDTSGKAWHRSWGYLSGWSDWRQLESVPLGNLVDIAVGKTDERGHAVVVMAEDGSLWSLRFDTGTQEWSEWKRLPTLHVTESEIEVEARDEGGRQHESATSSAPAASGGDSLTDGEIVPGRVAEVTPRYVLLHFGGDRYGFALHRTPGPTQLSAGDESWIRVIRVDQANRMVECELLSEAEVSRLLEGRP